MDESLKEAWSTPDEGSLQEFWRFRISTVARALVTWRAEAMCAVLLLLMSANMVATVARKSITADEIVLIPAAYYHLIVGDFYPVHEHPPLCKILSGIPLLFIQPNEMTTQEREAAFRSPARSWMYTEHFWERNQPLVTSIWFWTRVPMIALTVLLGLLLFSFTRELFGPRAAVLAVLLFSIEPTFLAHGRVIQTDVPAAFGLLLTCFAIFRYVHRPTAKRAALAGLASGVALLAKYSMLIIVPGMLVVFLVLLARSHQAPNKRRRVLVHAAIVTFAALMVINAAYYFDSRPLTEIDHAWIGHSFPDTANAVRWTTWASSYFVPTDYVLGVIWQIWHSRGGHPAGLLGMYSRMGWWYYFPVAFALKTTLPFLILSLGAIGWSVREMVARKDSRFFYLVIPFTVYTLYVLLSPLNIGIRYYLPAYTFLFILGGALLDRSLHWKGRAQLAGLSVIIVLLGWMCLEAFRSSPHHMTYMNQLASQRPHWWYLSDSNVEWGDDVSELGAYLREHGETRLRGAFLGGFITLRKYGVEYIHYVPPSGSDTPKTKYVAIGASFLNGSTVPERVIDGRLLSDDERVHTYDVYRRRTPVAVFGNSIYLFDDGE